MVYADTFQKPAVSFATTDCNAAYLINLFENGAVEYRGAYGVKTLGKHEGRITPQAVKLLLKRFEEIGSFTTEDDSDSILDGHLVGQVIYIHQNDKVVFFDYRHNVSDYKYSIAHNLLFQSLKEEFLKAVNAKQWFDYANLSACEHKRYFVYYINPNNLKFSKN
jgi:hypothetical protein